MIGITFILVFATFDTVRWYMTPHTGYYIDTAPNGVYIQFVSQYSQFDGKHVFFPICTCEDGALHGYWNVTKNVDFPVSGEYCLALADNTIVRAELLREWNTTIGDWVP
jgi:hypothetical protein